MQIVQVVFVLVLGVALSATLVAFVGIYLSRLRRTRSLRRAAQTLDLAFSREDRFDLTETHRQFALMACGHNGQVRNVAYGVRNDASVRAFDYRFEAGHGSRRATRHYGVVLVDPACPLAECLLWESTGGWPGPLDILPCDGQLGSWGYVGNAVAAGRLREALADLSGQGVSVETRGHCLLLAVGSLGRHLVDATAQVALAVDLAARLREKSVTS